MGTVQGRYGKFPAVANTTTLRTDDVRRFVHAGIKALAAEHVCQHVLVRPTHQFSASGLAYIDEGRIELVVPRGFQEHRDMRELAQILRHEVDHLCGLDHVDMTKWWLFDVAWIEGLRLRERKQRLSPRAQVARELERQIRELWAIYEDLDGGIREAHEVELGPTARVVHTTHRRPK